MNRNFKIIVVVLVWLVSIGITYKVVQISSRGEKVQRGLEVSTPDEEIGGEIQSLEKEVERLRQENDSLRVELGSAKEERDEMGGEYLKLALGDLFRSAIEEYEEEETETGSRDTGIAQSFHEAASRRGFGAYDDAMTLMYDLGRSGMDGFDFLEETIYDESLRDNERVVALNILGHINEPEAFETVLEFRNPELTELDYPYDLIRRHVRSLPTPEIRHRIPEITQQIYGELGADTFSPERPEILASLAFVHRDSRAQSLLKDSRIMDDNVSLAINLADEIHTYESRQFVKNVSTMHSDHRTREQARQVLESWQD